MSRCGEPPKHLAASFRHKRFRNSNTTPASARTHRCTPATRAREDISSVPAASRGCHRPVPPPLPNTPTHTHQHTHKEGRTHTPVHDGAQAGQGQQLRAADVVVVGRGRRGNGGRHRVAAACTQPTQPHARATPSRTPMHRPAWEKARRAVPRGARCHRGGWVGCAPDSAVRVRAQGANMGGTAGGGGGDAPPPPPAPTPEMLVIHASNTLTREYTPGASGRAQPAPQLTTPVCTKPPAAVVMKNGPPAATRTPARPHTHAGQRAMLRDGGVGGTQPVAQQASAACSLQPPGGRHVRVPQGDGVEGRTRRGDAAPLSP